MSEAVDPLPGLRRDDRHQLLILRLLRQIIRHPHAVQRRTENGIIHRIHHLLAEHIYLHVHLADALDILFSRHECHNRVSFSNVVIGTNPERRSHSVRLYCS